MSAALHDLAADIAARHGDNLERQRKPAEHRNELRGVADADELRRHRGDDLLPRQRPASALHHVQVLGHFVGAVNVHRQLVHAVQVEHPDAVGLQPLRARFRGGHRALDAALDGGEGVDEEIDRRARADPDHLVFNDMAQRGVRHGFLQIVLSHFFLCGGRSVQTPSKASAAMPTDSPSVGWGWMVLPMSVASAPISTASASSLMRSPAPVPTIPPPTIRWSSASKMSLVKPSSRALAMARPEAAHGNFATPTLVPFFFASSSVRPTQAISGSVKAT